MKLKNVELIPGVVVDDLDPKYLGRVKVSAPGEFDPSTADIETMFWAYPILPQWGYQGFSRLLRGSKVWLIKNTENYYEYWYVPYFEMYQNTYDLVNSDEKYVADVVVSRVDNGKNVQIYYNSPDGIKLLLQKGYVQLHPNGDINIETGLETEGDGKFNVNSQKSTIIWKDEKTKKVQPAALGDNVAHYIKDCGEQFSLLSTAALTSPYTHHLSKMFSNLSQICMKYASGQPNEDDVRAMHVYIN